MARPAEHQLDLLDDLDSLVGNGWNGTTNTPLLPPQPLAELAALIQESPLDAQAVSRAHAQCLRQRGSHLGPRDGVDTRDLASAGWAVIFAAEVDPAVREALAPLLAHREAQAARDDARRFRELSGEQGYRAGESKIDFFDRLGVAPGANDPERLPYYLLLVGDPEAIPFEFQHDLDRQHAVGRLSLPDAAAYARYAAGVVAAETAGTARHGSRRDLESAGRPNPAGANPSGLAPTGEIAFFGVRNPGDVAMERTADYLIAPLVEFVRREAADWKVETRVGAAATKAELARLLGGEATPDLLFTACHGMGFNPDDPRQLKEQGAFLCQDWPGPASAVPVEEKHFFAAHDLRADARLQGLIAFHFACHSVGTPAGDSYPSRNENRPQAPRPFIAQLPQTLLGHPGGSALAVIGHIDRTWGYSFLWQGVGVQTQAFEDVLSRLLTGAPIGHAMEPFGQRYLDLFAELGALRREIDRGRKVDPKRLVGLWTATQDTYNYALLGDPAVSLPAAAQKSLPEARA